MYELYQLVFTILAVVVGFAVYKILYPGVKQKSDDDPAETKHYHCNAGIPGLKSRGPQEGNFPDMAAFGTTHDFLAHMHRRFGPVFSFWWGPTMACSVYTAEDFRKFGKIFDRPPEMFKMVEPVFRPHSIQYKNGEEGKRRHTAYTRCFSSEGNKHYVQAWHRVCSKYAEVATKVGEGPVAIRELLFHVAIDSMLQISFGEYYDDPVKIKELRQAYDFIFADMEERITGKIPPPGSEQDRLFNEHIERLYASMRSAIDYRKEHPSGDPENQILIDVLLDLFPDDEESLLSDAVSVFIASFHTTGLLLSWTLYFLGCHQDIQDKICEEIIRVLGDRNIEHDEIGDLVYTKQVLDETLRCSVLAPFAARVSDHDIEVDGYTIPAGTPTCISLGVAMVDEARWKDPFKFDPDRFSPNKPRFRSGDFEPFGFAGKRKCPGYRFAYAEATIFLTHLLRKVRVETAVGYVAERDYGFVTKPKEEVMVHLKPR